MFSLRKRIKELQENTTSIEARNICKELLENFSNLPDSQIFDLIIEKMKKIEDGDKHVKRFVSILEKIEAVTNLGVASGLEEIQKAPVYTYPGLMYSLGKITAALGSRFVKNESEPMLPKDRFKISSGVPEYLVIDETLQTLKNFVWDPIIEKVYTSLQEKRNALGENIDLAVGIYNMKGKNQSFFFDSVMPKLEEHFVNPTEHSRTAILEDLRKMNFYPAARKLSEALSRVQAAQTKGIQVISDNSKCTVSSIYSPLLLENGMEYFFVRGNFYNKKDGKISKINENDAKSLPDKFKDLCRILSSPSVFVKEGKVSFYLKKNKVEIFENNNVIEVLFNGNKINSEELAKNMVSAGLFMLDESKAAYDIQAIVNSFSNIYDLDFGKIIESRIHPGSYVILMKEGDNVYVNRINESTRSNEFFADLNATQARNTILEFIGFDIKESLSEYLEKDEVKLKEMRDSQIEIVKNIAIVETNLTKVNTVLQDNFMASSPELAELKSTLEQEISKLRTEHRLIGEKIKTFESAKSECGCDVGDEVKLNDTGDTATVVSVNSSRDTLTVVTSKGKTIEVPVSKISSIEAEITKAEVKNENAETEVEDKEVKTDTEEEPNPAEYVQATISAEEGGKHAGDVVKILADDYTSKGDEDFIEAKVGDEAVFVAKKFINLNKEALEKEVISNKAPETISDEDDEIDTDVDTDIDTTAICPMPIDLVQNKLKAKLQKSLDELEDIRNEMKTSFTSSNTISGAIQSLKGMIDALQRDQMEEFKRAAESIPVVSESSNFEDFSTRVTFRKKLPDELINIAQEYELEYGDNFIIFNGKKDKLLNTEPNVLDKYKNDIKDIEEFDLREEKKLVSDSTE